MRSWILRYLLVPVWRPVNGVRDIIIARRGLARALLLYLALCLLYTGTIILGYLRGFGAPTAPLLVIEPGSYYLWEAFFAAPVYFLIAIAFAGTAHLVARGLGGRGTFDDVLTIYAVATILPTVLTMWLPETVFFAAATGPFAPGVDRATVVLANGIPTVPPPWPVWLDIGRIIVGTVLWPLAVSAIGIRESHRLSTAASVVAALAGMVPVFALVAVFIR